MRRMNLHNIIKMNKMIIRAVWRCTIKKLYKNNSITNKTAQHATDT